MADITILEEQTLSGFEDMGGVGYLESPALFPPFTAGTNYRILWDGTEYICTAMSMDGAGFVGNMSIGDPSATDTGEPFIIAVMPGALIGAPVDVMVVNTNQTGTEHTLAVYEIGEEESGVIVKDRNGNDVEHVGATAVRVRTLDGSTKDFVDGDTIPEPVETTVELDFSAGDMVVLPGVKKVFSKVSIQMPETLIPENIAEGVDVAGIIGTKGGGAANRVDYTLDESGEIIGATLHGMDTVFGCSNMPTLEWIDLTKTEIKKIPAYAFSGCNAITSLVIPNGVTTIPIQMCYNCLNLETVVIPESVTEYTGNYTFGYCSKITEFTVGKNVTALSYGMFFRGALSKVVFEETSGWYVTSTEGGSANIAIQASALADPANAAKLLGSTYAYYYWYRR